MQDTVALCCCGRGVFRVFCSFFASHPSCGRTIIFHHHCACGAGCRASADFGLLFLASTYACDTCRTRCSLPHLSHEYARGASSDIFNRWRFTCSSLRSYFSRVRRLKMGTDRTYIPNAPPASECFTAVVANIDGFAVHTHTNESMTVHGEFVICREVGRKVHTTCCI